MSSGRSYDRRVGAAYDEIGGNYSDYRRPDERIERAILDALGDSESVVNVGAGAGSYEPTDRAVIAVEPSTVMASQRPPEAGPAVIAAAEALPLEDDAVDAALAVLTIHHWSDAEGGVGEMKRVARRRVVLLTVDPRVEAEIWLLAEYFPAIAERDRTEFPPIASLRRWLGAGTAVREIPVPRDCRDGFLLSFWGRPEAVLDDARRAATSGFARLSDVQERDGVERLREDLASGRWDDRHGSLRRREELDAGLRLIVADL